MTKEALIINELGAKLSGLMIQLTATQVELAIAQARIADLEAKEERNAESIES